MRLPAAVVWAAAFAAASSFPFGRAGAEASRDAVQDGSPGAKSGSTKEQDELARLRRQVEELSLRLDAATAVIQAEPSPALVAQAGQATPPEGAEQKKPTEPAHKLFEPKPGPGITFFTPRGEITFYGYVDLSIDATTKGIGDMTLPDGTGPEGNVGWMPAISTNLSYLGARGFLHLDGDWRFLYQLETQIDIAATSGSANSNSQSSAVVKGALTSRNSFIGIGSSRLGSLKIGKTDAPYKLSTQRMNPFSGEIGDYSVVMGNTGGDNRVEFGTRLDHSIWYESPKLGQVSFALLFSPGQNRSGDSDQIPAGGPECAGGNIPGSGGTGTPGGAPISCNDGSFSDAFSAAAAYEHGPIYVTGAYERHRRVNRNSDIYGIYGFPLPAPVSYWDHADVADEDAWKVGAQVKLPTGTSVSAIFEDFHRYVPDFLAFQNERQRTGYWLEVSQQLGPHDSIHVGWAHANKTPGDPGQHNTAINPAPGVPAVSGILTGGSDVDNRANMITAALKHELVKDVMVYAAWAATYNAQYAHYDLGAGGRAVTTDCHDGGLPASGDTTSNPHCWAGGKLMGVSVGLNARF
jgi:predicted porin